MQLARTVRGPTDRALNRAILGVAVVLLIGVPLIGALYFLDQYRSPGMSIPDRAIQAAEDAVRKNPNSVSLRFSLARAYDTGGRTTDAVAQYDEILKLTPKANVVRNARADDKLVLGDLEAAARDYQAVVDDLKSAEMSNVSRDLEAAYFGLGQVALKRGDAATAGARARDALKINSTDADAFNLLGLALLKGGDGAGAITQFRNAIGLVPVDWCDPYAGLSKAYTAAQDAAGHAWADAMLAFCQGRTDEAKAGLTSATSGKYAVEAYIGLGLLAEKESDASSAAVAYRQALARDPQNFLATTGLGRVGTPPTGSPLPSTSGGN